MPFDIALRYDPQRRRCDLALAGGDLAIDRTPATAMLCALFSDRRARPDDPAPAGAAPFLRPASLGERRGWALDALDGEGRRLGSLLWLLERERQSEQVRLRAIAYAEQALAGVAARMGAVASVEAAWLRRGTLGLVAHLGGQRVRLSIAVAG